MNRGLSVCHTYRLLVTEAAPEDVKLAHTLGWCIEMLQACFLVADDIMDKSVTRRGQPCWYLTQRGKQTAINDAFLLESCVYRTLRRHFMQRESYTQLLDLFQDVTWQTELG